jgi:hypothetical protein
LRQCQAALPGVPRQNPTLRHNRQNRHRYCHRVCFHRHIATRLPQHPKQVNHTEWAPRRLLRIHVAQKITSQIKHQIFDGV